MLKRVSVQNFKSLKDVTLDLQKVNLLIGPNNSGKTNFLKALTNFNDIFDDKSLNHKEDVFGKNLENKISIRLIFEGKPYEELEGDYINAVYEDYGLSSPDYKLRLHMSGNINIDTWTSHLLFSAGNSVMKTFAGISQVYKPDPNKITQPGPVGTGEEVVNADVSNLVGFLDLMLGKYRRPVFNRTEIDLHKCISEFDEINLEDAQPTENLRKLYGDKSFKRIGLSNSQQNITFWADELSEGTLYFIALLCIINQPNPPKLLLLEEPEKGIHPRRIREVMDFIFRLAEEKDVQIILTTHNENVLNEFTSMPEAVFVFEKDEEGATHVKNLLRDIIEPSHQQSRETETKEIDFTRNLGENWMYGLLGGVPEEAL